METYLFGSESAPNVLIQPVDSHDLEGIENEVKTIRELADADFRMIAVRVPDWNRDLSPWTAPAVFGKEGFGDGAADFLDGILPLCPEGKTCYIGGYSLAGLFALWAAYRTGRFRSEGCTQGCSESRSEGCSSTGWRRRRCQGRCFRTGQGS